MKIIPIILVKGQEEAVATVIKGFTDFYQGFPVGFDRTEKVIQRLKLKHLHFIAWKNVDEELGELLDHLSQLDFIRFHKNGTLVRRSPIFPANNSSFREWAEQWTKEQVDDMQKEIEDGYED